MKIQLALLLSICTISFYSCIKDDGASTGKVVFEVDNAVGGIHVNISGNTYYTDLIGNRYSVSTLNYFMSNIVFVKSDGSVYAAPNNPVMIVESNSAKHTFTIDNVPNGTFKGVYFTLGVDSLHSVNGPFSGDLDKSSGMYWNDTDGFIYFDMEGKYVTGVDTLPYSFHVGGYKSATGNALSTCTPDFAGQSFIVDGSRRVQLHFFTDLEEVLMNPTSFKLDTLNTINAPGANSVLMAKNYADFMHLDHIHN